MANMLNVDTLQLFADIVDTGSFSRAAERNYLSQSAVSQRLRALEREYGTTLIYRGKGKGSATPTTAGDVLYTGAKRILREASMLDSQLRESPGELSGTVRLVTVYSVGLHALPPRLKPFLAGHPLVNVHLEYKRTDEVYQAVVADTADIGIVACPGPRRGLDVIPFGDEEMVVICAPEHSLAKRSTVRLTDIDGLPFFGFDTDIPTRKLIEERLAVRGVRVRMSATFDNIETIKNLVEIGNGISIVPAETVNHEVRAGALVAIPLAESDAFRRPTGLLVKPGIADRAVLREFIEAMRSRSLPDN